MRPNFFLINLTNNCNLKCRYCFQDIERTENDSMDYSVLLKTCEYILRYCQSSEIHDFSIRFWGGELLFLFDKIIFVCDFFEKHRLSSKFFMETNGTLISKAIAYELMSRRIKIGISIDGPANYHDLQRPFSDGKNLLEKPEAVRCLTNDQIVIEKGES